MMELFIVLVIGQASNQHLDVTGVILGGVDSAIGEGDFVCAMLGLASTLDLSSVQGARQASYDQVIRLVIPNRPCYTKSTVRQLVGDCEFSRHPLILIVQKVYLSNPFVIIRVQQFHQSLGVFVSFL